MNGIRALHRARAPISGVSRPYGGATPASGGGNPDIRPALTTGWAVSGGGITPPGAETRVRPPTPIGLWCCPGRFARGGGSDGEAEGPVSTWRMWGEQ